MAVASFLHIMLQKVLQFMFCLSSETLNRRELICYQYPLSEYDIKFEIEQGLKKRKIAKINYVILIIKNNIFCITCTFHLCMYKITQR